MKSLIYLFSFLICVNLEVVFGHEEDVFSLQYNTDNFEDELSKKNHFVLFYAPW